MSVAAMAELIRDSTLGKLIRYTTQNRYLLYAEERDDFQCPYSYQDTILSPSNASSDLALPQGDTQTVGLPAEKLETDLQGDGSDRSITEHLTAAITPIERIVTPHRLQSIEKSQSRSIEPVRTSDGSILVDWYTNDDPENPRNWSLSKKIFVSSEICIYTFTVYIGSSIYTGGEIQISDKFGISIEVADLGLALYVLAYGTGPLLFSPLSEIPAIGRSPPYIITLIIFTVLWIPAALVNNFAGLLVLRFLAGFFGSPCLATGGASFQDIFELVKVPYMLAFWAGAATFGPALGPIISSFSVQAESWRWSSWEMLWLSGPVCALLLLCLPETSSANILYRRAQRLRRATGNQNLRSQSEIDQKNLTVRQVTYDALIKPTEINLLDPAVLFTTVYTGLVYGSFYSFFQSFPLVYPAIYHFGFATSSLPFFAVLVGLVLAASAYCAYWYHYVDKTVQTIGPSGLGSPETRLVPGLFACVLLPTGLFIFAWTANPSIHWIGTVFGLFLTLIGTYIIMQCMLMYLAFVYPQYGASLFAANDFSRSGLAAASVIFSRPMFIKLGIGWGVSLLAFLNVVCCVLLYGLWWGGERLRARSRFAVK